jgi:opacity protein-like surface antigen
LKKIAFILATASSLAALTSAHAEDLETVAPHQWYVSVFGGYTLAKDQNFSFINSAGVEEDFAYNVSMDDGYSFGGTLGYIYNDNVRFDIEVAHSSNDYGNDYNGGGFTGLDESGRTRITTVLANAWLNANTAVIDPYIGGGFGFGHVDSIFEISNGSGRQLDGSDIGLAAQLGAGVRFAVSENLEIDAGYRLRNVFDVSIDGAIAGFPKTTEQNFLTHTVQIGATLKF